MIKQERIEAVKQGVDLVALIKSRGIELKKKGKGYVGLCPFHAEETPSFSVNPAQNLWQCFGCNTGGDAIRFVELFDKMSFPEALEKLDGAPSAPAQPAPPAADKRPAELSAKQIKLLSRVIEFYHKTFCEDGRARSTSITAASPTTPCLPRIASALPTEHCSTCFPRKATSSTGSRNSVSSTTGEASTSTAAPPSRCTILPATPSASMAAASSRWTTMIARRTSTFPAHGVASSTGKPPSLTKKSS